ncbi:nose resistant to fluoxetine protein 6 [Augochlora pura]
MALYRTCLLLAVLLATALANVPRNESNILRLGKSRGRSSITDAPPKSNGTETEKDAVKDHGRLIAFSRNNPELDWRNQLRMFDRKEEAAGRENLDVDFMRERPQRTANSIQWLADLYDPLKWARVPGKLAPECRRDLELFIESLRAGKLWAAKMSDASGRYSSQFHFGNGFWLGSSSLCRELNHTDGKGRPIIDGKLTNPPYLLKFHVARMLLALPTELQFFQVENSTSEVRKFLLFILEMVGVGGAIGLLMLCATIYECRTLSTFKDVESSSMSNNNERLSNFSNKNLNSDHGVSTTGQDNGEELIEKGKDLEKDLTDHAKVDKRQGLWIKCLTAFNPITNGSKIISTEPAARDSLTCLHGLRVFSLGWVVMVHTYLQVFAIAENKTLRAVTERNFMFQTISNATFSVDTFFFISGLLVTILFYRSSGSLKTDKESFTRTCFTKFVIMVLYRFIRLTPAYLFVLGINEIAIKQAQARTVFSPVILDHLTCEKFWWRNALYLNSLYPRTEMCMLWSWYMANDTQFYVLGILLLLLSVRFLKVVAGVVLFLLVSSWFTTFLVAYSNDYVARIQEPFALFDELYDKPWMRAGPYFVGIITGYILFKTKCKLKLPLAARAIGWLISSGVMFSLVYGLYPGNLTVTVSSVYAALGHTAWAVAVSFIVIQCCTGSAKMIDSLLSLRLMYPLSRLTYCAYLVHPVIMMITVTQMDGPLHLHNDLVLILYFGNLVASYLMSFCISIGLEAPIVNLLKIAFISKKRGR